MPIPVLGQGRWNYKYRGRYKLGDELQKDSFNSEAKGITDSFKKSSKSMLKYSHNALSKN